MMRRSYRSSSLESSPASVVTLHGLDPSENFLSGLATPLRLLEVVVEDGSEAVPHSREPEADDSLGTLAWVRGGSPEVLERLAVRSSPDYA